jgi:hypothetical protein
MIIVIYIFIHRKNCSHSLIFQVLAGIAGNREINREDRFLFWREIAKKHLKT